MNTSLLSRAFVVSCAIAAAAACNNAPNSNATNAAPPDNGVRADQAAARDQKNAPIAIDGCLQKGSGGTFLLTKINEPAHQGVGTSGPSTAVEQEQLWLARNEYRVDPQHDVKIDDLVGKQVHVTGTIADTADLADAQRDINRDKSAVATGTKGDINGADIKQGDLAKIDASGVSVISDSCGASAAATSGKKASKASGKSPKK